MLNRRRVLIAFSRRNRQRKARLIQDFMRAQDVQTVIFVGAALGPERNESVVESSVAQGARVLAACDVMPARTSWPFVVGDGRALPFADKAADLVMSNAVIEHVGDVEDQRQFVLEHARVGRMWVLTTPNRWFPVESHTGAAFRHWSAAWRASRTKDFTRLLSRREFADLLPPGTRIRGGPLSPTFIAFSHAHPSGRADARGDGHAGPGRCCDTAQAGERAEHS